MNSRSSHKARVAVWSFILVFGIITAGCLGPVEELYPEDEAERPVTIYLVRHGWHVGLVLQSEYILDHLPAHEKIPESRFLKFGWGDKHYYPDPDPGFGRLLSAALLPTQSVVHIVGFDLPVERYFTASDIIQVQISVAGMDELANFITDRFRLNEEGELLYVTDGRYNQSSFFLANGFYYIPKTSNTWTARALRRAGCPITPFFAVTSGNLVRQTKSFGVVVQERR